jgi:hypothetical protein
MRALLFAWLLIAWPVSARDWAGEEIGWGAAAAAVRLADWAQTRNIVRDPDRFRETNPLIGEHPSRGRVDGSFVLGSALLFGLAHYLPEYRKQILQWVVVLGAGVVARNASIGVRMRF